MIFTHIYINNKGVTEDDKAAVAKEIVPISVEFSKPAKENTNARTSRDDGVPICRPK